MRTVQDQSAVLLLQIGVSFFEKHELANLRHDNGIRYIYSMSAFAVSRKYCRKSRHWVEFVFVELQTCSSVAPQSGIEQCIMMRKDSNWMGLMGWRRTDMMLTGSDAGNDNHQLVTLRTRVDFTKWQLWQFSLYLLRPACIVEGKESMRHFVKLEFWRLRGNRTRNL